jgi:hypothetical protein
LVYTKPKEWLKMADNGRRKRGDDALAVALAGGKTPRDAAAAAGIAERTATRRWADPAFRRHVAQLRADMVARAMGNITEGITDAAAAMRKLLKAKSESVRLGACRAMLELGVRLREAVEIEERLTALQLWSSGENCMSLKSRIARLEKSAAVSGCPGCAGRQITMHHEYQLFNGESITLPSFPGRPVPAGIDKLESHSWLSDTRRI